MIRALLTNFPYMAVPMIAYALCGLAGPIEAPAFQWQTYGGDLNTFRIADGIYVLALACLVIEAWKSLRLGVATSIDMGLSILVFMGGFALLLVKSGFGSTTFLMLVLFTLADLFISIPVAIQNARRDFGIAGNIA